MVAKLNKELTEVLKASGECAVEVVDPDTQRTYYIVDGDTHLRAMEALQRQQDHDAIAEGLKQMERGQGKSLDQAFQDIRSRLEFPDLRCKHSA